MLLPNTISNNTINSNNNCLAIFEFYSDIMLNKYTLFIIAKNNVNDTINSNVYISVNVLLNELNNGSIFYHEALSQTTEKYNIILNRYNVINQIKILSTLTSPLVNLMKNYIFYICNQTSCRHQIIKFSLKLLLMIDGFHPYEIDLTEDNLEKILDISRYDINIRLLVNNMNNTENTDNWNSVMNEIKKIVYYFNSCKYIFKSNTASMTYLQDINNLYCKNINNLVESSKMIKVY